MREQGISGGRSYTLLRNKKEAEFDGWRVNSTKVNQPAPGAAATVERSWVLYLARQSGLQDLELRLDLKSLVKDMRTGFPTVWTIKVSAPQWDFGVIRGQVESQSPTSVSWRVTTKTLAVARSVGVSRSVTTTQLPSVRHQNRVELIAVFALAVFGIGLVAALLVARLAGPATTGRWVAVTLVLALAVGPLALSGIPSPPPSSSVVVPFYLSTGAGIPPDRIWTPGPALGIWLWYVLPMAGWWFTRRLVTGRPPSARVLLVCGVSALLPFLLMAPGGTRPTPRGWFLLALIALIALAVIVLLRQFSGTAAYRWSLTAGALVWVLWLALMLGRRSIMAVNIPDVNWFYVAAVWVATWPVAAWLTSLLGPVLRRSLGVSVRAVCFLLVWGALMFPFAVAYAAQPPAGVGIWSVYRQPFFTGYLGLPLCVVVVCGVILQVVYLFQRGADGGRGRAVEPVGRVLLVCAVILALGSPSLRTLTMWGDGFAVLWVAVTSLLVLPIGSAATAAKFRRISRQAHARFMDGWVRAQLLWDTRASLQRAARSSLTEDMSLSAFSTRWRELDVPGRCGDPATRLARAKRFALGSAAGVAPRTAGLAGAALAQALALPWAIYELVTGSPVGADAFMPFFLGETSVTLRFLHWTIYGFVFGYFYPLLRGLAPIGKAAVLMLSILPAEILPMVTLTVDPQYAKKPSWRDMAVVCGGLAGQTFVICMGLGLCWEWWLARVAGMKWSQVRNFRRLSSVTVPAGTVLVAAATAFATVVAGTWAQQELVPPSADSSSQSQPSQQAP
ncbi:hypothetical protein ACIBL8_38845 [Streptomyces sp. NPDC050523]|uniref:hypothetical protein n=1 Tax=Streptomyces sp. NPDC050523 TaxID=3365622 RepID=UPI0037919446